MPQDRRAVSASFPNDRSSTSEGTGRNPPLEVRVDSFQQTGLRDVDRAGNHTLQTLLIWDEQRSPPSAHPTATNLNRLDGRDHAVPQRDANRSMRRVVESAQISSAVISILQVQASPLQSNSVMPEKTSSHEQEPPQHLGSEPSHVDYTGVWSL